VREFLRSHHINYFDVSEHRLISASLPPREARADGIFHIIFWFDADGRLTRHWIGTELERLARK